MKKKRSEYIDYIDVIHSVCGVVFICQCVGTGHSFSVRLVLNLPVPPLSLSSYNVLSRRVAWFSATPSTNSTVLTGKSTG